MDRLLASAAPPLWDRVLDSKGMLVDSWRSYFGRLPDTLDAIPSRLNVVSLSTQVGDIAATDFSNGSLLHGLYRLTYYVHVIETFVGTLITTLRWTDGGVACWWESSFTHTVSEDPPTKSESILVRIDKGTPITYETSGVTNTYNLDVTLEKMKVLA